MLHTKVEESYNAKVWRIKLLSFFAFHEIRLLSDLQEQQGNTW